MPNPINVVLQSWSTQFEALANVARTRTLSDVEAGEIKRGANIVMRELLGEQYCDINFSTPQFRQNAGIMFVYFPTVPIQEGRRVAFSLDYSTSGIHWKVFIEGFPSQYCSPDQPVLSMGDVGTHTGIAAGVVRSIASREAVRVSVYAAPPVPVATPTAVDRLGMAEQVRWFSNTMDEMRATADNNTDDGDGPFRPSTGSVKSRVYRYFKRLFVGTPLANVAESSYTVRFSDKVIRVKLHIGESRYMTLALDWSTEDNSWRIEMDGTRREYHSDYYAMDMLYEESMDRIMAYILSDLGMRENRVLTAVVPLVPVDRIALPPNADHVYRLDMA